MAIVTSLAVLGVPLLGGTAAADEGSVPADVTYATSPAQDGSGHQYTAPYQWWKVALTKGDVLQATIAVTSGADDFVYLWLFLPGTTHKSQGAYKVGSAPITYTATQTGDYLFCVYSSSRENTSYRITWTRTPGPTPTQTPTTPPAKTKPVLIRLSPTKAKVGAVVTLTGKYFGSKRGSSYVKFGARKLTKYVSWSGSRIRVKVPQGTARGNVKVTVRTSAGTSTAKVFTRK